MCVLGIIKAAGTCLGRSLVQKILANKLIVQMLLVDVYICTVFDLRLIKVRMKQCWTLGSFHFHLQRRSCALWCSHSISEHWEQGVKHRDVTLDTWDRAGAHLRTRDRKRGDRVKAELGRITWGTKQVTLQVIVFQLAFFCSHHPTGVLWQHSEEADGVWKYPGWMRSSWNLCWRVC